MKQFKFSSSGFTLIELILYVALVSIMLVTLIPFAWNVIEGGIKVGVEQEVYSQARYLSERIKKEVRGSTSVITCTTTGSIRLELANTIDPTKNTRFCYASSEVTIVQGNPIPACPGTNNRVHSTDTSVTVFTCTNYTGTNTDNVQINFTLTDNYASTRSEYAESIIMQLSAETRN